MRAIEYSLRVRLTIITAGFLLLGGACSVLIPKARAQVTPRRVLIIYWDNKDYPGNIKFDSGFKAALQSANPNVEYYPEYYETSRFPGQNPAVFFREYLREKYAGRTIDVVVASADIPLNLLIEYRADLFPNSPIVFVANNPPNPELLTRGPGATGVVHQTSHRETLDLALKLHPDTKHLFVISGSPERDRRFETIARQHLNVYQDRVDTTYLTDLPVGELVAITRNLPPSSVVLYIWQQSLNERGAVLQTYEVLAQFAATSSAPIYGMGEGNLGQGIVGGYLHGPERNGEKAAELVARILNGTRAQDIPIEPAPKLPMFDWRELRRWGISENSLPSGSIVRFKQFTFWELYKWRIIAVSAIILLQAMFIAVLLVERRRRLRANELLDRLNAELEQRIAARTAALDAKSQELETFAYSVAHDLKAPLRGIDGYSRLLLEDHRDSLNQEGRTFLETIHTSTEEMNQLIEDLLDYSRLERRELRSDRIELQPIVNTVIAHKRRETGERSIDFIINVNGGSVSADANGLTQALNNYLDNAIKFTRHTSQARIEIGSEEKPQSCLLWVRDNGVGFDMKYHDRIFDIFQRLNRSEDYPGTGVGLAIVRKAMERMGGRAWGVSEPGKGATFYLEIPK